MLSTVLGVVAWGGGGGGACGWIQVLLLRTTKMSGATEDNRVHV